MKKILFPILLLLVSCTLGFEATFAQESKTEIDSKQIKPFSFENYNAFKKSAGPLLKDMSTKKIIGLGEGTHGTSEFYKVRFWISRYLIEEKGFRYIAFENDFSDVWFLNDKLAETTDINTLMKNHLMSIWQNEEMKELLNWIKTHNKNNKQKVVITGLDYPLLKTDVDLLMTLLKRTKNTTLNKSLERLANAAKMQDEAWIGMNDKTYKANMKVVGTESRKAYLIADTLEKQFAGISFPTNLRKDFELALTNIKQGFAPFYELAAEGDRDSIMASNVAKILKDSDDKMIVWAHNAHLGKGKIYGGAVGGTGGYLLKLFPNNYFVLGTGTSSGSFAGTVDVRPTNNNPMQSNKLEEPIKNSWEELLKQNPADNFYFYPSLLNVKNTKKPSRLIGFGIKSGASTYDTTNLSDLYDAYLFMKNSNASTPLK